MNNLRRELAPISEGAWEQIEQEASRTLKRYFAARRVVDLVGPKGLGFSAVGTGQVRQIESPGDGIEAVQRDVRALVELRVPFDLSRLEMDSVERGSSNPDLQPLKDAARKLAHAEDRIVFEGYAAAGIQGISQGASNVAQALPPDVGGYPAAVAQALDQLRRAGVDGPYRLLLGDKPFTDVGGATDNGYPVLRDLRQLVDGEIIWAPAMEGGMVLTGRGGDFELHIGQDVSIGYLDHSEATIRLYLQETLTFLMLTAEAAVMLERAGR
ncbi:family 1 encapsulin nanocompartment shell protein [Cupriavidus sp. 2TAF22]|uniref:family 1 encapsulin nanocompartment shell protein n=1 Tax=unclassified Cupriavidus TaxID=2640874 RepID=UPI003F8EE69A